MMLILQAIETFLGSDPVLFTVYLAAFFLKIMLLAILIKQALHANQINQPLMFLCSVVFASMISDSTWLIVLLKPLFYPNFDYRILLCISATFCIFFTIIALTNFNCTSNADRMPIEYAIETIIPLYCLFILLLPSLITAWHHARQKDLPLILKQQIVVLIKWL